MDLSAPVSFFIVVKILILFYIIEHFISTLGKPAVISEFGCLCGGGMHNEWFGEALHEWPQKYPFIISILFGAFFLGLFASLC